MITAVFEPKRRFRIMSRLTPHFCRLILVAIVLTLLSAASLAQTETVLYDFTGAGDGWVPYGSLVADSAGNYYGTTLVGGRYSGPCSPVGCGTVFEISPNGSGGWIFNTIYRFKGEPDGAKPSSNLIFDSKGDLYGTTRAGGLGGCGIDIFGCGTVFKLSPSKSGVWAESVIYDAPADASKQMPEHLAFDSAGNLYGTLFSRQATCPVYNCGYVFKLRPASSGTWRYSVVHAFDGLAAGGGPDGITFDGAGNMFVTTFEGGSGLCSQNAGCGTVVKFTPNGSQGYKLQVLYSFSGGSDGGGPLSRVILDSSGNLFGAASVGGYLPNCAFGCGTVFELTPSNGRYDYSVLYSFGGKYDGSFPVTALTLGSAGDLYGLGSGPLSNDPAGFVYKLSPSGGGSWIESTVHTFKIPNDGGFPYAYNSLIEDPSGKLFGTLPEYGTPYACGGLQGFGCGVIYEITP
jgi:hypothetical protein